MSAAEIRPALPAAGDTLTVLGVTGTVDLVEPYTDYQWQVTLTVIDGGGHPAEMRLIVPTDYRTTDDLPAYFDPRTS